MVNPFDTFAVIAQLSVTFAGFGSLASSLGQRSGGADAKLDAHRLGLMLIGCLTATVVALVPATLSLFLSEVRWVFCGSSIIALITILGLGWEGARRAASVRNAPGFSRGAAAAIIVSYAVCLGSLVLCAVGYPQRLIPGLYQLALMAMLTTSAINFWLVTRSLLQPYTR